MNTTFENKQKVPLDNKYSAEMIFLNYYPTERNYVSLLRVNHFDVSIQQ